MRAPIDMNESEVRSQFDFSKPTRGRFQKRYQHGHTVTLLEHDPDFVLNFKEAKTVLEQKGYAETDSWRQGGYYFVRRADAYLKKILEPFRVTPVRWRQRLQA